MKKKGLLRKWVTMCLALAMVLASIAPGKVQAANKSLTMYVGEAFEGYLYGTTISSVKSSNAKVVKAAKVSDRKYAYTMTAKKTGTATITVKYKTSGKTKTYTVKLTVKKLAVDITTQSLDGGYVLFKIKNNTAQSFNKIAFSYTLRDANGTEVAANTTTSLYAVSKSTTYETAYIGSNVQFDDAQSSVTVTAATHDPSYTYKNTTKSQLVVTTKDEEKSGNTINFSIISKNKLSKNVCGTNYIMLYDANNNIIGVETSYINLSKKETRTSSASLYVSEYTHPTYDHYEIVTRAYSYK
jgi:hypothetical protein